MQTIIKLAKLLKNREIRFTFYNFCLLYEIMLKIVDINCRIKQRVLNKNEE